jgi:RNA polymerase subunit RPABC4/transcription elongation factor Spt4
MTTISIFQAGMSSDRTKVCHKCRAFLPKRAERCPYCNSPVKTNTPGRIRCPLCGSLEFKVLPKEQLNGKPAKGRKRISRVCRICSKEF